jgi:3'(2'), 5'-bisphosphate nucleotidase
LDGTQSYLDHREGFAINIALCDASGPVLGVVADPLSDRIFAGTQSKGPLTVSLTNLSEHRPITPRPSTRPYRLVTSWNEALSKEDLLPASLDAEAFLMEAVSGALKFCLLATGEADVHARSASYMEWDCAAGDGILRSMGIAVRDRETNQPLTYNSMSLRVGNLYASRL